MVNTDIRKVVDGMLRAQKQLVGISSWARDPDSDSWRWLGAIEINDELPGISLVVKVSPRSEDLKFSIMLNLSRCFWRLDFTKDQHLNPLKAPFYPGMIIQGPHCHPWADNRVFATANSLPKKLPHARLLPESIQGFHPALRWFLDETNIYMEPGGIPDFPKRDTLL